VAVLREPFHQQVPEAAELVVEDGVPGFDDDAVVGFHRAPPTGCAVTLVLAQDFANKPLSSAYVALFAKPSKRPSASSRAARRNPPHAAPAKALPTLTRRTPSLAKSASVKFPGEPIRTFTGLGATACTIAVICSGERAPGAYRQSAPACAYAFNRFTDSFNASECPVRKHSARPINITSSPEASIASRAARMRATASSNSYSGCDASPLASSIDKPATPVSMQRRTFFFKPSMSREWPS